ncbi:hypothetical protein FHR84_000488 [Actinopolyspora biskrensis]|uniref:Uncharacterized protein n=1 Tax=Actinopolyspora biskrensis TaxID=1470178 RepID=A0A852YPG6_9ACTN|nr:hypothetical protein [Actinopolyspora biskrensis]NYH77174.1 hypothetical protein [Actinopolyspora biskrensis]
MSTESTALTEILRVTFQACAPVFEQMSWSEDEIRTAQQRHPHAADTLHHSFTLLRPTSERMNTEFVYRGHCRELLDRVATGKDTRPGTAAEIVIALCGVAMATPINTAAEGLVFRMWATAFPEQSEIDTNRQHRERLHGARIDDAESLMRTKLTVADRALGPIACSGRHHGERVTCTYAAQPLPRDPGSAPSTPATA